MHTSFILSFISIGLGILIYFLFLNKKKNVKANLFLAIAIGIISIAILVFPLLEYENVYTKAFASFIYGTKCIGMGENLEVLSKIDLTKTNGYIYFIFLNILFIAMPLLTAGFILSFLEKLISFIRLSLSKNKKLYVFSEVNEKSLLLAKSIEKQKDSKIIFAKVKDKTSLNVNAIKLNKKVTNIKFNKDSDVTFFMISKNEEQDLNETLELIELYKDREKTKIYVINQNEETPVVLDSTNKGKITVEIVNEKERAIFNLLNDMPLYLNSINNTISILIVGCGSLGQEFLRDATWCSMILGYKLEMLVIDLKADKIKENLESDYPELLNNYDIKFLNLDIKSSEAIKQLKSRKNINYILVSMNTDEKNISAAIMLRRLFIREFNREPIINLWIENEYKQDQILNLVNEKGNEYKFNAFGGIKELYQGNTIIDSNLERLAIQVNLAYDPNDTDLHNYNLREYNKRSSRASAIHLKYKMYSILKEKFTDDMKTNQEIFKDLYSKEIEQALIRNEHDRWTAYTRSIGYISVSTDKVASYYKTNKSYIHYLARMHPALVEFDKLDEVSNKLSKITGKKIDLIEKDKEIVSSICGKIKF